MIRYANDLTPNVLSHDFHIKILERMTLFIVFWTFSGILLCVVL